tara:strand:- start:72 stop:455 length:384 start_codon:yes stop_codon:yes gene_type:complete
MAKHRSAYQLLQDAQKHIAQLKERVAREVVSDHKEIKAFDFRIGAVQKQLTKVRRWTNPENGLDARISKLKDQIEECQANLDSANETEQGLESEIASLKADRTRTAREILESQDIDIDSMLEQELGG